MPSDAHDSRRKHRRSSSPDDHDKSSKRHKHRHHHHRHRHGNKKRDEEIQFDDETVATVPSPSPPPIPALRNDLNEDDVEEGEILDDEVEAGEIEVKEDRDLRSDKKIPGLPAKSSKTEREDFNNGKVISPTSDAEDGKWRQSYVDSRIREDDDSPNHSRAENQAGTDALDNGFLDVKSSKRDKRQNGVVEHFKGTEKLKGDYDDEALEARREVNSHRNSSESVEEKHRTSGNSPLNDGYRSRSRSIGRTRDRSRSRSVVEEYAHRKSRHSREHGSLYYTSRHTTDYDLDEERAREYRRENRRGSKDLVEDDRREHSTRYHSWEARDKTRDKDRSRDKDVERDLHREKKREETSRNKEVDWDVEIHADISKAVDGKSDDVDDVEPSFSVGKSPPENVDVGSEKVPGAGGLGEGTPKSERSADKYCDDIFGETPTGVRKSGKGDGLLIERAGLHDNWDDAEGYYSYRFGEILDGRYEVTAAHGKGVFSTVVRAKNLKAGNGEPDEVAIKIIRNNDTMYKAGLDELVVLKKLVGADPDDKRHCVRFLSSFKLTAVRAYAKQLFIALKHLRNCGVLHCDIKPDNMLVNEAKNVLKLCDFGNAMFAGKNEVTPYLVSRFYRAPEIILGLQYDHPLDIWSVGCCLYELYTGKVLFPGLTNNDMLRLHMELKGPFPKKMLRKGAFTEQHYDHDLSFYATEEDPVTKKTIKRMMLNIKAKDIGTIITGSGEDPKMVANFKDLLDKIFVLDPEKRLTVSQALNHPFITGK
ncbi:hypothetical protein TSUD_50610 [Trifolium subterraneum]|uniref:Serine/threonine-protein kinase PRP4 homolog n=1 Tax=Trifolium subterraneum TaxID=3900 RepID=A0A2Z6MF76_TRISU|nr:hypothetical protein TSUD_50610 [Trifolium subterraneum]